MHYKNVWFSDESYLYETGGLSSGEWVINYLMQQPILFSGNFMEELEFIPWNEFIYYGELTNNPCTNAVFSNLKNTRTMFRILKQFKGSRPIAHMEWKLENISANGSTAAYANNELIQIRINSSYANTATPISMARTMLHEAIHAEVLLKLISVNAWPPNPNMINAQTEFPGLWDYWVRYKNSLPSGADIGTALHNHLADWYRARIKAGLIEFDVSTGNSHLDWQYEALTWGGLDGSAAWTNFQSLNPTLSAQYYTYIQQQQNAGGCP
ncbi:MAG: hypothetical protein H7Y86_13240 [Rhizobacter sp.]|nr:hypothetical protein [Ferruginibacter sp.]